MSRAMRCSLKGSPCRNLQPSCADRRSIMHARVRVIVLRLFTAALCALAVSSAARAQTTTATISGTVTDRTGAVLPGVAVEVRGDTVNRTVVTDADGFYRAVALPPGHYHVVAQLTGFQSPQLEDVDVAVNRTATIDIRMEIAQQSENIVVRAPISD